MSERIPNAKYIELEGEDHLWFVGDVDAIFDEVEEFLTGVRRNVVNDRMLATVLFTDIVASRGVLLRPAGRPEQKDSEDWTCPTARP